MTIGMKKGPLKPPLLDTLYVPNKSNGKISKAYTEYLIAKENCPHPNETSVPENPIIKNKTIVIKSFEQLKIVQDYKNLEKVFDLPEVVDDDNEDYENFHIDSYEPKLPKVLSDFKNKWIFGPTQEKDIWPLVIEIYNAGIKKSMDEIEDEYRSISGSPMVTHLKNLLAKNYVKI